MYNVLYIEDTYDAQKLVTIYLKNFGTVDCYEKADDVLDILRNKNYDIILMDINLPGKYNGVDAIRLIRETEDLKTKPVIALTAYAMIGDKEKFLEIGADDYLAKPFLRKTLLEKMEEVLKRMQSS